MKFFTDFLSLLYPEVCPICGNALLVGEKILCTVCFYKLPKTNYHLDANNPVQELFSGRVNISHAATFLRFSKGGMVQRLIHEFKYKNKKEIGFFLGELYANELMQTDWIKSIDYIIPIPLHPLKLKKRGFNQSEVFANGISNFLDIPVRSDLLSRIKFSETQTKKSKYKRWENVKDIFEAPNSEALANKHILLVDDVITTGATIEAASQHLLQIENVRLNVAALAFAAL